MEENRTKPTKVVREEVSQKKSLGNKIRDTFVKEDAETIGDYLLLDIIIPWIKDGVVDVVTNGINMLVYGNTGGRKQKNNYTKSVDKVSWNSNDRTAYSKNARASQDFSDIVMKTRSDALNVLNGLRDRIEEYETTSVADFYDLVGITSNFTDNNYGWSNLDSAYISQVRGGYILVLPKPKYLE